MLCVVGVVVSSFRALRHKTKAYQFCFILANERETDLNSGCDWSVPGGVGDCERRRIVACRSSRDFCYVASMDEPKNAAGTSIGTDEAIEALLDRLAQKTADRVLKHLEDKVLLRPRLLNYRQAAKYLGFDPTGKVDPASPLRQRKQKGQLPDDCSFYFGGTLVWDAEALDSWIDSEVKAHRPRSRTRSAERKSHRSGTLTSGKKTE